MKRFWFAALIILPFLVSCPTGASFSDLEGFNLLSTDEQGFTGWAIDYGLEPAPSFAYMRFDPSDETGPDSADTVYRAEIVNLMPNGDFRAALSGWTDDGAPTYSIISEQLNYEILNSSTDRINFDLNGINDGLQADASYMIRFQLKPSSSAISYFQFTDPLIIWSADASNTSLTYEFPGDFINTVDSNFVTDPTNNIFTIGTTGAGGGMKGDIDNMRIARTDISSCVVLDVPVTAAGRPDLLSGTYRFTVYIKDDPDVTPNTDNRMPAANLCLAVTSSDTASVSNFNAASYEASTWASGWTACSVTGFIQIDSENVTALRLRISPTDTLSGNSGRDVGSLLISAPVLEYSSTGSF